MILFRRVAGLVQRSREVVRRRQGLVFAILQRRPGRGGAGRETEVRPAVEHEDVERRVDRNEIPHHPNDVARVPDWPRFVPVGEPPDVELGVDQRPPRLHLSHVPETLGS